MNCAERYIKNLLNEDNQIPHQRLDTIENPTVSQTFTLLHRSGYSSEFKFCPNC